MTGPSSIQSVTIIEAGGALRDPVCGILSESQVEFALLEADEIGSSRFSTGLPACILLDLAPPGRAGASHLKTLRDAGCVLPVICLTAWTDVRCAVTLMKAGAFEVLEAPLTGKKLLEVLDQAFEASSADSGAKLVSKSLAARLSSRERMVLERLLRGETNKMMAGALEISIRTVEFHRRNINRKLGVSSLAELIALNNKAAHFPREPRS